MNSSTRIEVAYPTATNAIRSHDHPILETGNLSFPKGKYFVEINAKEDNCSYVIHHRIEQAPLIELLIEYGLAEFATVVSSPLSAYRSTHSSRQSPQTVIFNPSDLGEPPYFTPAILCSEANELVLDAKEHGVHQIWDGHKIRFERGSRLALGGVIQLESSMLHLLSLNSDPCLSDGQIRVEVKSEPFHFYVKLGGQLLSRLRYSNNRARPHIMTHIVSACLSTLQNGYRDDDGEEGWKSIGALRSLAEHLEAKNLLHWSSEDFHPEEVATALYPHILEEESAVAENGMDE